MKDSSVIVKTHKPLFKKPNLSRENKLYVMMASGLLVECSILRSQATFKQQAMCHV